jgi:aspartate/methionine/tyrosine aminotransferase
MKLANRVDLIPEYIHFRLGREMKAVEEKTGRKVLHFGIGSPDVKPSEIYLEKLTEFFHEPKAHMYPGYTAIPEFKNALVAWYQTRHGVSLETSEVDLVLGGKDLISHIPFVLFDKGDEVLVPDPGYPSYTEPAILLEAKPVPYDLVAKNNFKLDFKNIESKITPRTKAIWINFPSNPTGEVITLSDLEEVVAFAKKHNIFVLYDNAYSDLTFDGFVAPSILKVAGAKDIAIELGSFSKTFSFAGYRMGWIVGNKEVVQALVKIKSQMDSGMSLPLQKLGAYALNNFDKKWHTETVQSYKDRRDIIAEKIKTLGLTFTMPKGGMFIWARIPDTEKDSETFAMNLLREKQILITPGSAFGKNGERYVRVSYCADISKIEEYF